MNYDTQPKNNFFAANWREMLFAILLLAMFYGSARLIQWIDPTAGTNDFGLIHTLVFAAAAMLFAVFVVWLALRIAFKTFCLYLDGKDFRREFRDATSPSFRIGVTCLMIANLLWVFVQFARLAAGL